MKCLRIRQDIRLMILRDIGDDRDSDDRLFPKGVSKNAYIIELSALWPGIKLF